MRVRYSFVLGAALTAPAIYAADMALKVEIPRLNVAEYHKPYAAFWIETPDQQFVRNLSVWYDLKKKNDAGTKWLKDVRQWWRKSGRDLTMPVDGLSGATRAPGEHEMHFGTQDGLNKLPAGDYVLVAEASREAGGREVVRVPFAWPPKGVQTAQAKGAHELGAIALELKP